MSDIPQTRQDAAYIDELHTAVGELVGAINPGAIFAGNTATHYIRLAAQRLVQARKTTNDTDAAIVGAVERITYTQAFLEGVGVGQDRALFNKYTQLLDEARRELCKSLQVKGESLDEARREQLCASVADHD